MKRSLIILGVTGLTIFLVGLMIYFGWGRYVVQRSRSALDAETAQWYAEYLQKVNLVRPLQLLKGSRPFTPREMQILREALKDNISVIRCRALTALAYTRDPEQRKEAIQLAMERLKDPEWVVRQYALWALSQLGAKEAIPQILPLLKDPDPKVRQQAKKTLQQLGYQVRE